VIDTSKTTKRNIALSSTALEYNRFHGAPSAGVHTDKSSDSGSV
jgi:hypothetical protein